MSALIFKEGNIMDKYQIIKFLINDSEIRIEKECAFKKAELQAEKERKNFWGCLNYDITGHSKQKIKDNLKMIRRLTLEIEKEL